MLFLLYGRRQQSNSLGFAVDFKRLQDGDVGPNTGGMGCYTPVPWLPADASDQVMEKVVNPLLSQLQKENINYRDISTLASCGVIRSKKS